MEWGKNGDLSRFGEAPAVLKSTVRRPKGQVTITSPEDPIQEYETQQCCHCQAHFKVEPGSGNRRGFCFLCQEVTCGNTICDTCVPFERKMEIAEGRDPNKTQF